MFLKWKPRDLKNGNFSLDVIVCEALREGPKVRQVFVAHLGSIRSSDMEDYDACTKFYRKAAEKLKSIAVGPNTRNELLQKNQRVSSFDLERTSNGF